MAHDIYICYDDNDLSIAEEIVHLFEDNGIKCFFKERDMEGLSFDDYQDKLRSSKALLLILSSYANDSVYVKNEVDIAFSYVIPIITFKIDDSNLEDYFEFFISLKYSIDAYPNYKDDFEYLLHVSSKLVGKPLKNSKVKRSIFSKLKGRKSDETINSSKSIKIKSNKRTGFTHDVFINYSTKDQPMPDEICETLENNGIKCWIAPRDFKQGKDINSETVRAVKNTKMMILIFSNSSKRGKYVQNDLKIAHNREKPIISFNIDGTNPEEEGEYYLKIQQWISAYPNPEEHYEKLVNTIFEMMPEASTLVPGEGRLPYPAYRGNDDYIFVSYAHRDADIVFEEIRRFQNLGYNVWYDEGIGAGNEWQKDIVAHLKNCKMFIVFVTNNSMASVNVQKEIKYAVKHNKNMIPIYLEDYDDIEMEDDIDFELSVVQDISKTEISEDEYVSKAIELFKKYGF